MDPFGATFSWLDGSGLLWTAIADCGSWVNPQVELFFESRDCSGTPHAMHLAAAQYVLRNGAEAYAPAGPARTVSAASVRHPETGECCTKAFTRSLRPVRHLGPVPRPPPAPLQLQ